MSDAFWTSMAGLAGVFILQWFNWKRDKAQVARLEAVDRKMDTADKKLDKNTEQLDGQLKKLVELTRIEATAVEKTAAGERAVEVAKTHKAELDLAVEKATTAERALGTAKATTQSPGVVIANGQSAAQSPPIGQVRAEAELAGRKAERKESLEATEKTTAAVNATTLAVQETTAAVEKGHAEK